MTTGRTLPGLSCVLALNCLQNSIIFNPAAPSAGPTGGEGFAAPPLTCNLTIFYISFDIMIILFQLAYNLVQVVFFFQKSLP
jgi:hypothetical protein